MDSNPAGSVTVVRVANPGDRDPVQRVLAIVGRTDLALTDELHRVGSVRPYAVSRRPGALDIVAFRDDLARALLAGDDAARIVVRTPLAELVVADPPSRSVRLAFGTPTQFRRSGLDHLGYDPETVFGNLGVRWAAFGGMLPDGGLRLRDVPAWPDTLSFRPAVGGGGSRLRGFVGVVRYDLSPLPEEVRAAVWTLARFAEYRGVGRGTGYGLGRVRLLDWSERWTEGERVNRWDAVLHCPAFTAASVASSHCLA